MTAASYPSRGPTPTANRAHVVARVRELGAVAVLRFPEAAHLHRAAEWLLKGGVSALEVTLTTPGAVEAIRELTARYGDQALIGAGSVFDVASARAAIEAGARFIVSPVCDEVVVRAAQEMGASAMPGGFTPTEILRAHAMGADVVKVFPSEVLGPAFIRAVRAPMPFLALMPTGGVTPDNVGDWLRAGAIAVGLGSALADPRLVAAGDEAQVVGRAELVARNVATARRGDA